MKFVRCDRCKLQFQNDLEQMSWKDAGKDRIIDVCPTCREFIKSSINVYRKSILNPIYDNKG